MFYVYILESDKGDLYTGSTGDLRKRLAQHNAGQGRSTKGRIWRCIFYEACTEERDARRREKYLKTTQGKRMLRKRLYEYYKNKNPATRPKSHYRV